MRCEPPKVPRPLNSERLGEGFEHLAAALGPRLLFCWVDKKSSAQARPLNEEVRSMAEATANVMEQIVSLCKRRAFVYPASEIYGGLNGFWDYGPLGVLLKNNIRDWWWR